MSDVYKSRRTTVETVMIPVDRFRNYAGDPTCCADSRRGEHCQFFGSIKGGFGHDVCRLLDVALIDIKHAFLVPHSECPLWRDRDDPEGA